jgi:glycosyltransferase involved in cell wall biosynthesis
MKVLFVSSGNLKSGPSPLIFNQGESIRDQGINVEYFLVRKKGVWGYLKTIKTFQKHLKSNKYDLIHAHYSFSGMMCSLSFPGIPIIVSLMGSDVNKSIWFQVLAHVFAKFIWSRTIVKSYRLKKKLRVNKTEVVPNGVNLQHFKPMEKHACREKLGWDPNTYHLLFAADPKRGDKNFGLTENALKYIKESSYKLHFLSDVPYNEVPLIMNASDVVLLSSPAEGSPNVIKEAMACNCPIVSTDVGDVREIFGGIEGCYIAGFNPKSFADNIQQALSFGRDTIGRDRIYYLDSGIIAKKIVSLYKELLEK